MSRISAVLVIVGGCTAFAATPAGAAGPAPCNFEQECEITAEAVPFGLAEEDINYTCTALTDRVAADVAATGANCWIAYYGTTTAVPDASNPTGWGWSDNYQFTWTVTDVVLPTAQYWICMQTNFLTDTGFSPGPATPYCSAGPI